MPNVTAVLLNWRRPHNIETIMASLRSVREISEFVIWDNSGTLNQRDFPGCRVYYSPENIFTLGRFKAAAMATNETCFTQDDDILVNNVPALLDMHFHNPDRIVAGLRKGHYEAEAGKKPFMNLGWGSVFRREWVSVLDEWVRVYGEDDLLRRKADRVFTILKGNHHPVYADITPLRDPNGRLSESSPDALYRRPDHYTLTEAATRNAVELRDLLHAKGTTC